MFPPTFVTQQTKYYQNYFPPKNVNFPKILTNVTQPEPSQNPTGTHLKQNQNPTGTRQKDSYENTLIQMINYFQ